MNSRFKFSLRTLIMIILAVCVCLTWINQWNQHVQIGNLTHRLNEAETDLEFYQSISAVVFGLNSRNPTHQRALQIITRINLKKLPAESSDNSQQFPPANPLLIPIESENRERMVLVFYNGAAFFGGSSETVAVLMENGVLIDVIVREDNPDWQRHSFCVEDTDQDDQQELVFYPRNVSYNSKEPETRISYPIELRRFGDPVESIFEPAE